MSMDADVAAVGDRHALDHGEKTGAESFAVDVAG